MSYAVNPKELCAVCSLPAVARYQYFLNKVADWQEVWGIGDDVGWSFMGDESEQVHMPVWPAEAFAQQCCCDEWAQRSPKPISLSDWRIKWLPGLENDGRNVAVFPLSSDKGISVPPSRLAADLDAALQQYE